MSQQPHSPAGSLLMSFIRGSDPRYREIGPLAVLRFVLIGGLVYAALTAAFFTWPQRYASYFRAFGNAAFEHFLVWPSASIRFLDLNRKTVVEDIREAAPPLTLPDKFPVPSRDKVKDTLLLLKNVDPAKLGLGQLRTGSRFMGFWPTVMAMSLAVATPWVWRRKVWLVLWCFVFVHVFIAIRVAVYALSGGFGDPKKPFRLVDLSDGTFQLLRSFDSVVNDNPTVHHISGVVIWLVIFVALQLWADLRPRIAAKIFAKPRRRDPILEPRRTKRARI